MFYVTHHVGEVSALAIGPDDGRNGEIAGSATVGLAVYYEMDKTVKMSMQNKLMELLIKLDPKHQPLSYTGTWIFLK